MTETNGWPGKPGVPLNPKKEGWHWFKTPDGELVPYNWRPAGECERGRWASGWVYDIDDDWSPEECTYLGPCLTPDEVQNLREGDAVKRLEAEQKLAHRDNLIGEFMAINTRERAARDALQARVAELERLAGLADSWITAALECKDWYWDADQHEAATHTRDELRAAAGEVKP